MGIKAQNQVTIIDITDAYSVILSNENQTFREVSLDGGTAAQTVSTTVYSYRGSTNVWSFIDNQYLGSTHDNDDGVYITVDSPNTNPAQDLILTIHIPAGLKNNGSIDIPVELYETSSTSGNPLTTFTKTFSYSVARYGSTGAAAVIYELEYTGNLFNFNNETSTFLSPTAITITASSQTGTNAKQAYTDGIITVTPYTSAGNSGQAQTHSSSVTINPTVDTNGEPDYLYYIATLSVGGNIVDRQTIGMNRQGANGKNAFGIDITSSNGFTFKNTAISTTLTAHVYSGGVELTAQDLTAMGLQVNWYEGNSSTATSSGITKTYSAGSVQDILHVTAKLEDAVQGS